ncbi:MAG: type II toxin-antitoxin system PemK/MazF family toxin [Bifidobacteriaceae bacterium]|jgi:mRNA interferase MazF|nr:type II toxin-antitoxin system PemK/MazF family toxin [Bifidobacteriaceae bacterium]
MARRGEIRWVDLGDAGDSAPAGRRPVLVVQADRVNRTAVATAVVATLTAPLMEEVDRALRLLLAL